MRRLLLALLAPLLFLLLLEGGLALTGWIEPVRLLKQVEHNGERFWTTNPEYGRIWYHRVNTPGPSHLWIPVEPDDSKQRVVLIGESAAAGFPYHELSLAAVTEAVWALMFPDHPLEVINLTMTGINSYALVDFTREAMKLQPDALVFYAGNNEAIGPFGPAAITGLKLPPRGLVNIIILIRASRVGQLASRAVERLADTGLIAGKPFWAGLDEYAGKAIAWRDPALQKMTDRFAGNVGEILEIAGKYHVPVLLASPAVNLTDWPPLGDEPSPISDDEALSLWQRGQKDSLVSAKQVYRLANRERDAGNHERAHLLFERARDLDLVRFRTDSRIQKVMLKAAEKHPERAVFMHTDQALRADDPSWSRDRELFLEHVHLSAKGLFEVSRLIVSGLLQLQLSNERVGPPPDWAELATSLWITEFDHFTAMERIRDFAEFDVFRKQDDLDERRERIDLELKRLRDIIDESWTLERIHRERADGLRRGVSAKRIHGAAALMFMLRNETDLEEAAFKEFLVYRPLDPDAWLNLARCLMINQKFEEAIAALAVLRQIMPSFYRLDALEGEVHARLELWAQAEFRLRRALRKMPQNYHIMRNLINVLIMSAQNDEAIEWSRHYLKDNDGDAWAMNNLAWILATGTNRDAEDLDEAVALASQAVSLVSEEPSFMGTLSVCYAAVGRKDLAREWYQRTVASIHYSEESRRILVQELDRLGVSFSVSE